MMRLTIALVCLLGAPAALSQSTSLVFIETVAGAARFDNLPARETPLIQPQAVWVHPNGDVYIADGNFLVRRIRDGIATIVAGGGNVVDDSVPVPGQAAHIDYPAGLAGTPDGVLYISDVRHHRIRRLNADGTIETVAGRGTAGYSGDGGRATFAELNQPTALAMSPTGQLYIADTLNHVVRRYDPRTSIIVTVAGTGNSGYSGDDGPATQADLGTIRALALDAAGNLYLSDTANSVIRRVTPEGTISRYAGNGEWNVSGDGGPATDASITESFGLAVDAGGTLYIAETSGNRVRRVTPDGIISTYAGQSDRRNPGTEGIPATEAYLIGPAGIALDGAGNLYIPESSLDLVRRVDAQSGIIATIAGTFNPYDGVQGDSAPLVRPTDVAADREGNLYIADNGHYRVRRIDRETGIISTVAGDGRRAGWEGATENSIGGEVSISIDPEGMLLIADGEEQVIRRVNPVTGRMRTIVDLTTDDSEPAAVVADQAGNIYVSDRHYHQIYRFSAAGFEVLAGIEGEAGSSGDDGPAVEAKLDGPEGLLLDGNGGLLFCDRNNHVVRRIDLATGIITRFAGDGQDDSTNDGQPATEASLMSPIALAANNGYVFIADSDADQIRAVTPQGTIITIAGSDSTGYAGDGGPAVLALFDTPLGLAYHDGSLFVCDSSSYRIRRLFVKSIENRLVLEPRRLTFRATQGAEAPTGQVLLLSSSFVGVNLSWKLSAPGFTGNWLYASYLEGTTPDVILVSVQHEGLDPGTYTARVVATSDEGVPEVSVDVELIVDPPNQAAAVHVNPAVLNVTVPRDGSDTQSIRVTSPGSNSLPWSVVLLTDSPWLSFSATSGATPANVSVRVTAAGLEAGTYTAVAYFVSGENALTLFVATMVVSQPKATLQLDREIMVFEAVEGSTRSPRQWLRLYNSGSEDLNWQIELPPDAGWLRTQASNGTVKPGDRPSESPVLVDPSGLRAGVYTTSVTVRAEGALGSPQIVSVRMRVLPASTAARPIFEKGALLFRASPGDGVHRQGIELTSTGGRFSYSTSVRTADGRDWLKVSPANGTVVSSAQKEVLRFQVNSRGLEEGVYNGSVDFSSSDGSVQQVRVVLILRPGAETGGVTPGLRKGVRFAGCEPSQQVMITPSLPNSFSASVGWPVILQTQVFDDCGAPVANSTVVATFSNGDAARVMTNLRDGLYTGTWTPSSSADSVTLAIQARHPSLASAEVKLSGRLAGDSEAPPVLFAGGVVNAASRRNASLMAPGSVMALTGAYLPENPDDVKVLINGSTAQVLSSRTDEIRILAPSEFRGQTRAAVIVSARGLLTSPEVVTVVPADPGLFPLEEGVSPAAGENLTVTATGLGAVGEDGKPLMELTARLGETDLPVTTIVPSEGSPGVFQLTIAVPQGASGALPLTIRQNGVASNSITVNVR